MGQRILIVVNDRALGRVLADNFLFEGFEVKCLTPDDAAAPGAVDFDPDVIVFDASGGSRDPTAAVERLRQRRGVPLILLSTQGRQAECRPATDAGATAFVPKPFDVDDLLRRARALLGGARA